MNSLLNNNIPVHESDRQEIQQVRPGARDDGNTRHHPGHSDLEVSTPFLKAFKSKKGLFLTGEGSSRLFPAKRAIFSSLKKDFLLPVMTESCTQSLDYNLSDFVVFAASNSGQTKEVIRLVAALKEEA
ncbi:MAG: hypothetical protein MZV63_12720 [Marinilabiliales bacterium]|nr:hypothetical protein [Marinilabiliales bacterium]